ncbi:hypothetical protein [Hornefia butyriciproducens]|uniref:hypothetical protein n=1 Tax=Hornefia butyriciproducens TaxID=2652293 RepID=UPI002A91F9EF|nr:hypothetical protein [Hornefia butyriciproducens]MDY5463504.1 hypothetical protein [Hornefia butyriciproducens]
MKLTDYRKYGNAAEQLSKAVLCGHISHAYIFESDNDVDKVGFAKAFASAILCRNAPGEGCGQCPVCRKIAGDNHEDVYHIVPVEEKKGYPSVKDGAIKKLLEDLKTIPTAGDRNIAIIEGADTLTPKARGHILKTLEEPAPGTVIILLSENVFNLSPPINSRCVRYHLMNFADASDTEMDAFADEILRMTFGGAFFFDICRKLDGEIKGRPDAFTFLDAMENRIGYYLRRQTPEFQSARLAKGVRDAEKAKERLRRNINYKYAVRELILKLEENKW